MTAPITRGKTAKGLPWPGTDEPYSDTHTYIKDLALATDTVLGTGGTIKFGTYSGNVTTNSVGYPPVTTLPGLEGAGCHAVIMVGQSFAGYFAALPDTYPLASGANGYISGGIRSEYSPVYLGYDPPTTRNATVAACFLGWAIPGQVVTAERYRDGFPADQLVPDEIPYPVADSGSGG